MAENGVFKKAAKEAEAKAKTTLVEKDGMVLHQYPDYETYVDVQTTGNKTKLHRQFVKRPHIEFLAAYLNARGPVTFGLCHGTRSGKEQRWFRKTLIGGPQIIGTEISDTATDFKDTVQWDFHDENPDWIEKADFVYSNSWDHAFDPKKAFTAWVGSLKPGGVMLLDHTKDHRPEKGNALDPFGITFERFIEFLNETLGDLGKIEEILEPEQKRASSHARGGF